MRMAGLVRFGFVADVTSASRRPTSMTMNSLAQPMDGERPCHGDEEDREGRRPADLPGPPDVDRQRDPGDPEQTSPRGVDEAFADLVEARYGISCKQALSLRAMRSGTSVGNGSGAVGSQANNLEWGATGPGRRREPHIPG
jgi:hypothetical protein